MTRERELKGTLGVSGDSRSSAPGGQGLIVSVSHSVLSRVSWFESFGRLID